eukprot:1270795-Amphidinium_carterae.1
MSHKGGPMPVPEGTPMARFPTPTLGNLRGYSWNENPYSWNKLHSGESGPVPLAASVVRRLFQGQQTQ